MKRRFPRFSPRSYAFLGGGLLLGVMLAPAAAQQLAPTDGQVVVRSDRAVYLINNGQRRWVATVQITDDEVNAYPEAEPIFTGLAPLGTNASAAPAQPASAQPAAAAPPSTGAAPAQGAAAGPTATKAPAPTPSGPPVASATDVPIEIDVSGPSKFEAGERIILDVKTTLNASCSLVVKWPDGTEADQGKKTPDSKGHCRYSIQIPKGKAAGTGLLKGTVTESGKTGTAENDFEILPTT
jgi:hypothetical protein